MVTVAQVQIVDEAIIISHITDIVGKGKNKIILLPAMGK